jgi:hypothetical protein
MPRAALLFGSIFGLAGCVGSAAVPEQTPQNETEIEALFSRIQIRPTERVCSAGTRWTCKAHRRTDPESRIAPLPGGGGGGGYGADDLAAAYGLDTSIDPHATIGIVDAYGYQAAESDLATYRIQYGLPPCTVASGCLKIVNQQGQTSPLPPEDSGWAGETALDLDMASAACPKCKIVLVQADDDNGDGLMIAQKTAATLGATYPSTSAYAMGVGGTSLTQTSSGNWTERAWPSGGSSCSRSIAKPSYQGADTNCTLKAASDVSAVGDPNTGVEVYRGGWGVFGGTSASSPFVAGVFALYGHGMAGPGFPYAHPTAWKDVTSGSNGGCGNVLCKAGSGWDGPTGFGSPIGAQLSAIPSGDQPDLATPLDMATPPNPDMSTGGSGGGDGSGGGGDGNNGGVGSGGGSGGGVGPSGGTKGGSSGCAMGGSEPGAGFTLLLVCAGLLSLALRRRRA